MNWSKIKWSNYTAFLEHPDNIKRFAALGGITEKEFMSNDSLASKLLGLNEDETYKDGQAPKSIKINGKSFKLKNSISFQYGLLALDVMRKFVEDEKKFVELTFVDLVCLHLQKEFTDEEEEQIKSYLIDMSVSEFWPIGNFFFLKHSKYLNQLMISANNALMSGLELT